MLTMSHGPGKRRVWVYTQVHTCTALYSPKLKFPVYAAVFSRIVSCCLPAVGAFPHLRKSSLVGRVSGKWEGVGKGSAGSEFLSLSPLQSKTLAVGRQQGKSQPFLTTMNGSSCGLLKHLPAARALPEPSTDTRRYTQHCGCSLSFTAACISPCPTHRRQLCVT